MQVTNVNLFPSKFNNPTTKAYGTVTFDNELDIRITIMDTGNGPWVSFPSRRKQDGKYESMVFVKEEARQKINSAIMSYYNQMAGAPPQPQAYNPQYQNPMQNNQQYQQQNNMQNNQQYQQPNNAQVGTEDIPF